MAFNNGFPVGYQPAQMYYTPQVQQPQQNNGMIWVQGEAAAKSYPVTTPNTTVQLWDSESQTVYLKSTDASGMPSMKILDYTIRDLEPRHTAPVEPKISYATKDDLESIRNEIDNLRNRIEKREVTNE